MADRIGRVAVGGFYARHRGPRAKAMKCVAITDRWINLVELPTPEQQLAGDPGERRAISVPVAAYRALEPIPADDPRVVLLT